MKKKLSHQSGLSTLLLVLVIALLLELAFFSMLLLARVGSERSLSGQYSRKAYYAVEGGLYDTFQILRTYPGWPAENPYSDEIMIGDTRVTRNLTYDAGSETYDIDIGSNFRDAKRRFTAQYQVTEETSTADLPLDIAIVIDRSGSMHSTIDTLKTAIQNMVNEIELGPDDRISIISYANEGRIDHELSTDKISIINRVGEVEILRGTQLTNIGAGMLSASEELDKADPPPIPRKNIIVFFTDGVANRGVRSNGTIFGCSREVLDYASLDNYAPEGAGTECSDNAITIATNQREAGYELFGVFYRNTSFLNSAQLELGSKILGEMIADPAKVYETTNANDLQEIFEGIGQQVNTLKRESYRFQEVEPLPN